MAQQTAVAQRPTESLIGYLRERAEQESFDRAFQVAADQIDAIMQAETDEEFWAATERETIAGKDLVDVEQSVKSFTVHLSDRYTSGIPNGDGQYFFVLVNCARLDNGEEFIWNTGAALLIGQLRWLEAKGKFPANIVIRGTDVGGGKTVLKFRPIPTRAVQGEVVSE